MTPPPKKPKAVAGAASPVKGKVKCPCNPSVRIGRVRRGNPYVPRNANPRDRMPDSVPPTQTYELEMKVTNWTAHCDGKHIDLSISHTSAQNGTATVAPAQVSGNGTFKLTVTGWDQTEPGHGQRLKICAKLDGVVKAESAGFTVCAHPINLKNEFASDVDTPDRVGVIVTVDWDSDSGTFADLDHAWLNEVISLAQYDVPPFRKGHLNVSKHYHKADSTGMTDRHAAPRPRAGPEGFWISEQLFKFKCDRCRAVDKPQPHSGLRIVFHVFKQGAQWVLGVEKFGAQTTIGALTSDSGHANVSRRFNLP
jgi:hypothetical protein